jgi:hypothetical protein
MRFIEALNRMLVGMLVSLVVLQAGLLFFMKNMEDQAEYRLVQNTSSVNVQCTENFFSEDKYWDLEKNSVSQSRCEGSDCLFSHMSWLRDNQQKDLQVVAVQSAPPFRWGQMDEGGQIRVRVKATPKPQLITLVSRQRLEWSFQVDAGAKIEKVIVATPQTVWLQGLPPNTPIEYLPKEKMCSYPYAWEEAFNADNEFRILSSVLKKITGLEVSSFQGALVGKEFRIPLFDKTQAAETRGLASLGEEPKTEPSVATKAPARTLTSSVTWQREDGSIIPQKVMLDSQEIALPAKTQQVLVVDKQLFILKSYLLWKWDGDKKEFVRMYMPTTLPYAQYLKTAAVSPMQKALYVYNDERGGEMYRYDVNSQEWSALHAGYSFNVEALYFDDELHALRAVSSRGPHLTQLLKMDHKGKVLEALPIKSKISFDKKHWKWEMHKQQNAYAVRFYQAVKPDGQDVLLEL